MNQKNRAGIQPMVGVKVTSYFPVLSQTLASPTTFDLQSLLRMVSRVTPVCLLLKC